MLDAVSGDRIPVSVETATEADLACTRDWQTNWTSQDAKGMPNKVALHHKASGELLGLMSYVEDGTLLAVEIIYIESAVHSNANLLHQSGTKKKYVGIAKALFAYAISVSKAAGYDGILVFKAKTSELVTYYMQEFGAQHVGSYDPFRLVIWEDAAEEILKVYWREI